MPFKQLLYTFNQEPKSSCTVTDVNKNRYFRILTLR